MGDLNTATWAASVAHVVELRPRTLKVVGSSPTRGSNFSLKGCCLGIWFVCLCFVFALLFTSVRIFIMYILSLEIGVFGGFITPAFSYMLSYIPPVNQVETLALPCFVLVCMGDLNTATWAASVAHVVELRPRTLKVVGSSPTRGSNFSLKGCCLGIWFVCLCFVFALLFTSVRIFIMYIVSTLYMEKMYIAH